MKKNSILTLILLIINTTAWGQVKISGTVVCEDKIPLPGVTVIEKGTGNGASTSVDGKFTIVVNNSTAVLNFSGIGFIPKEVALRGVDSIIVKLKYDCNKDFFDNNKVAIYAKSGIINTPFGGGVEFTPPVYFRSGIFVGNVSYQTNFDKKYFFNSKIELNHFISNCEFDIDAGWYYRKIASKNGFKVKSSSFEANLNLRNLEIIAGYSSLEFRKDNINNYRNSSGPLIGLGTTVNRPLGISLNGKIAFYKGNIEYQGRISRSSKLLNPFIEFYKLSTFTEVSVGVGVNFDYRIKRKSK